MDALCIQLPVDPGSAESGFISGEEFPPGESSLYVVGQGLGRRGLKEMICFKE